MKKLFIFVLIAILSGFFVSSCGTTQGTGFSSVMGKEWRLIEVHINDEFNREILFDRRTMSRENAGNFFTVRFDNERLNGTGAPNLFNAPYALGEEEQSISVTMPMASTRMALTRPIRLPEHDYFTYMNNVFKWELQNQRLVLHSKTEDEREIRMVFE
jgi:heat shock protein HslJ